MKIAIVTDAWFPQVNGVVTTLDSTGKQLQAWGHEVMHVGPDRFPTVPCPAYPSIRLAVAPQRKLSRILDRLQPDALHLATEGPLGVAGRRYCKTRGFPRQRPGRNLELNLWRDPTVGLPGGLPLADEPAVVVRVVSIGVDLRQTNALCTIPCQRALSECEA